MKKNILALSFALIAGSAAAAADKGAFVEPMLTYEAGSADVNFPSPFHSSSSEVNGFGLGARAGYYVHQSIFLGLDGRYAMPNYKNNDTGINANATSYNIGPVVGIQLPTPISSRLWVGYVMAGVMDVDKDQGIDLKFKDASGFRLGGGIKVSMVSLNLEYQEIKYGKTEVQSAGPFTGSTNNMTQDNHSLVFSVSLPLSL